MMEKLWNNNPRNSQQQKDRHMRAVFVSLTTILIIIFLTPVYLLVTDPEAPRITRLSSQVSNFRVSANREYITSDWEFTFSVKNFNNRYTFLYESINADMLDTDKSVVVASTHYPSFSQGTNSEKDLVLKFSNTSCSISELNENDSSNGGNPSGNATISITMRWKLRTYNGSVPRSRYNGLNVDCDIIIAFSFNNSKDVDVSFADDNNYDNNDDNNDDSNGGTHCDAHLVRI